MDRFTYVVLLRGKDQPVLCSKDVHKVIEWIRQLNIIDSSEFTFWRMIDGMPYCLEYLRVEDVISEGDTS
jgi:hypothetical protein